MALEGCPVELGSPLAYRVEEVNLQSEIFTTYSRFKHGDGIATGEMVGLLAPYIDGNYAVGRDTTFAALTSQEYPRGAYWLIRQLSELFGCEFACAERELTMRENYGAMTLDQRLQSYRETSLVWSTAPRTDTCILVDDICVTGASLRAVADLCRAQNLTVAGAVTALSITNGKDDPQIESRINGAAGFNLDTMAALIGSDHWLPNISAIKYLYSADSAQLQTLLATLPPENAAVIAKYTTEYFSKLTPEQRILAAQVVGGTVLATSLIRPPCK